MSNSYTNSIKDPQKNAAQFFVTIAGKRFKYVGNISLQIERKVGDVLNKFSMSVIDDSSTNWEELDRIISWAGANKKISVSYGNKADPKQMVKMSGLITDYSHTFLGGVYKLELSGYMSLDNSKNVQHLSGYKYRLDWQPYFSMRKDEKKQWGWQSIGYNLLSGIAGISGILGAMYKMLKSVLTDIVLPESVEDFEIDSQSLFGEIVTQLRTYNNGAYKWVADKLEEMDNNVYTTIKHPTSGKTLRMPVPDLFVRWDSSDKAQYYKDDDTECNDLRCFGLNMAMEDVPYLYDHTDQWGAPQEADGKVTAEPIKTDDSKRRVLYTEKYGSYIWVGDFREESSAPSWLNIDTSTKNGKMLQQYRNNAYSAAIFVNTGEPVRVSEIVKKLADLEGWTVGKITRTMEIDGTSEALRMNSKAAFQYILEDLCPLARTSDGSSGNFVAYFDSKDRFYFEPLNTDDTTNLTHIKMGYNCPNSPVISFSIKTKGAILMSGVHDTISSINSETGTSETAEVALSANRSYVSPILTMLSKIDGNYITSLGYGKESTLWKLLQQYGLGSWAEGIYGTEKEANKQSTESYFNIAAATSFNEQLYQFLGYDPYSLEDLVEYLNNSRIDDNASASVFNSDWYKNLQSSSSLTVDDLELQTSKDINNVEKQLINADMVIIGDYRLRPNSYIQVDNFCKGGRDHFSSGKYWIQSITDTMDSTGYRQRLDLVRFTRDNALFSGEKKEDVVLEPENVKDIINSANEGRD